MRADPALRTLTAQEWQVLSAHWRAYLSLAGIALLAVACSGNAASPGSLD